MLKVTLLPKIDPFLLKYGHFWDHFPVDCSLNVLGERKFFFCSKTATCLIFPENDNVPKIRELDGIFCIFTPDWQFLKPFGWDWLFFWRKWILFGRRLKSWQAQPICPRVWVVGLLVGWKPAAVCDSRYAWTPNPDIFFLHNYHLITLRFLKRTALSILILLLNWVKKRKMGQNRKFFGNAQATFFPVA